MSSRLTLCVTSLVWLAVNASSSFALSPCPPQDELKTYAKTIVEARIRSLSISPSGLLEEDKLPIQAVKAEFEIERVIKGSLEQKAVVVYGTSFSPGPFKELAMMALLYGLEGHDSFEWELSRQDLGESLAYYSIGGCAYYKFPDFEDLGNDQ